MPTSLDHIRPENYERAFCFNNIGYLLADYTLSYYRKRDFLVVFDHARYRSYISKAAMEQTLRIGREIVGDATNFDVFARGFREVIDARDAYLIKAKTATEVTMNDLFDLQALSDRFFYYFEKTEFFFADGCYEESNSILEKNRFILGDDLKMKSRPLLVELLTTVLYRYATLAAQAHGLDSEDVKFWSKEELMDLLETGKPAEAVKAKERQESFVLVCENQRIISLEGEQKKIVLQHFAEADYSNVKEFKGTVANSGKVTARARVILAELNEDYEAFVKKVYQMEMLVGEILVTETTSPDFVPLMKKAGGIIANQGGLNSHAAIMSRELGVPCLVGTHHATDILQTGDLIELDATAGTVKILEKKGD